MTTEVSPQRIIQTGLGFWASKTLLSAVELGVFTGLGEGGKDLATLTREHALHPRSARDFFDALVALGFLQRHAGLYTNTNETSAFLDRNKPSYLGGILEMANARLFRFWNDLTIGLKTGEPQNEVKYGGDLFGELYADPARLLGFLAAMTGLSHGANKAIARILPWANYKTFVDVGTAQGDLAVQVALAQPHLTGIGFDLPVVGPIFAAHAAKNGVAERVQFRAGDFFKDELPRADVVTMGHILHDWDLETKRMLIKKAYDALPSGGTFLVYEELIDDAREQNAFGLLMSLNMLIETRGGFDYTGADCIGWMKDAGFRECRVHALPEPDSLVIGIK
jgi:hypothetical protein